MNPAGDTYTCEKCRRPRQNPLLQSLDGTARAGESKILQMRVLPQRAKLGIGAGLGLAVFDMILAAEDGLWTK